MSGGEGGGEVTVRERVRAAVRSVYERHDETAPLNHVNVEEWVEAVVAAGVPVGQVDAPQGVRVAVEAARALHTKTRVQVPTFDRFDSGEDDGCVRCGPGWPCATLRALEGVPVPVAPAVQARLDEVRAEYAATGRVTRRTAGKGGGPVARVDLVPGRLLKDSPDAPAGESVLGIHPVTVPLEQVEQMVSEEKDFAPGDVATMAMWSESEDDRARAEAVLEGLGFRRRYRLVGHPAYPDPLHIHPPTAEKAAATYEEYCTSSFEEYVAALGYTPPGLTAERFRPRVLVDWVFAGTPEVFVPPAGDPA